MSRRKFEMSKKRWLPFAVVLILVITISVIYMVQKVQRFESYMEKLVITDVDLSEIEDGTYRGVADSGVIKVIVDVVVMNHQMTFIELVKHHNGKGDDADIIVEDIIQEQTLEVDDISGATLSSQVIKKAVENAFE